MTEAIHPPAPPGALVTVDGVVVRVLADDHHGSRHQRFLIRLASGRTVLVAHNIDLAERVPLEVDDTVTVRGDFEWSIKGGTVHWTHLDPRRSREGGWVLHKGVRYQ